MFRQTASGYNAPLPGTVEYLEVRPATRGGGWIVNMVVSGKSETMVFANQVVLTQTLMAMLNGAVMSQLQGLQPPRDISQRPDLAPKPELVTQPVTAVERPEKVKTEPKKRGGGRPKLTDEQKAANRAARAAAKLNSGDVSNTQDKAA